ncbi:DUF397 domain-containing protein [Streptomyces sp. NPDC002250]|jgi:hypothetical protein|uniref:DUF397 domain-containing protein n=1 Tax=unclassified Streptomyces TaxID=2593676 RepID=UPI0036D0A477
MIRTTDLAWFKSSYSSSSEGDSCVEVALDWFKSSYSSGSEGDSCVEVAPTPATIHIRDSKQDDGPLLTVTPATWATFVAYASQP